MIPVSWSRTSLPMPSRRKEALVSSRTVGTSCPYGCHPSGAHCSAVTFSGVIQAESDFLPTHVPSWTRKLAVGQLCRSTAAYWHRHTGDDTYNTSENPRLGISDKLQTFSSGFSVMSHKSSGKPDGGTCRHPSCIGLALSPGVHTNIPPQGEQALAVQGKSRGGSLSWFIFVLSSMPFSPHRVSWVFWKSLFPCKGRATRRNTNKQAYGPGINFAQNLPQIHESGYSTKFLAEFLGLSS